MPKYLPEFIEEGVKSVLLRKRCTQQKLAKSTGVSKTTVHHWIVDSALHVHSNSLRPILTEENRLARFEMAMDSRDPVDQTKYQDMRDQIHVDEKGFFSCGRRKGTFSIKTKNPKHCVNHKSHITKVMFLCAVARPHLNPCSNSWWDGKLGIWPIGDWDLAKWKSKNRPKATLVWKNKIVTEEVYRDLLISKLIPSILEKWPRKNMLSRKIFIQQDGAKSHISCDDKLFNDALVNNGINATLCTQAVNSPYVSLLDLSFLEPFRVSMMLLPKMKKN